MDMVTIHPRRLISPVRIVAGCLYLFAKVALLVDNRSLAGSFLGFSGRLSGLLSLRWRSARVALSGCLRHSVPRRSRPACLPPPGGGAFACGHCHGIVRLRQPILALLRHNKCAPAGVIIRGKAADRLLYIKICDRLCSGQTE